MSEEEILKQLRHHIKLWHKGGFIPLRIKKSLDSLLFYKDWEIAGINTKTSRQRAYLIKTQKRCQQCGSTRNLQQDHIHPKSKGGSDGLYNKQLLCGKCNLQKADQILNG